MRRWRSRWSDLLVPLSEAGLDLVRAEYGVVSSEVRRAARRLAKALLLLLIGLFALFWAIGAVALVVLELGSLWLPRWGAALVDLGLFLVLGLLFAVVARRRLRGIEYPIETVRRRLSEHRDWWDRKIAEVVPSQPGPHGSRRARGTAPASAGPDQPAEYSPSAEDLDDRA